MIAEKLYVSLYLLAITISFVLMLVTGVYEGEFSGAKLGVTNIELFAIYLGSALTMVLSYGIYKASNRKKIYVKKIAVNERRLSYLILFILVAQIIFLYVTGVGRLLSDATSPYSPIFSAFTVPFIFSIYYLICRRSRYKKLFWANVILFSLLQLSKGWSSFILLLFLFEIHFFFIGMRMTHLKKISTIFLSLVIVLILGSKVYQSIEPFKNEIRGLSHTEITYVQAVSKLTSRLTYLPISVGGYEKQDALNEIFFEGDSELKEIVSVMRPVLPRFVMENKEFVLLSNDVLKTFYPDIRATTSSDMGIFIYSYLLWLIDPMQAVIFIGLALILLILGKIIFDSLEQYPGQLNLLWFLLLFKFFYTGTLEVVFSGMLTFIIYFVPVLFIFGVLKIKRSTR